MAQHEVRLERAAGADEGECRKFLQCLYGQLGPDGPHRDRSKDSERNVEVGETRQEVPVIGPSTFEAAKEAVRKAAVACRSDWEDLYTIVERPAENQPG